LCSWSTRRIDDHVVPDVVGDPAVQTESGDAVVVGWNGWVGFSPSTGPKESSSGFQRFAQFRPGPVVIAISISTGPGAAGAAGGRRSTSRRVCFHWARS